MKQIPIIDLNRNLEESILIEKLQSSFSSIGFAVLTNHGIPNELIDKLYEISKKFFMLSENEKLDYCESTSQGYIPRDTVLGIDKILNKEIKTQYETFAVTRDRYENLVTNFPNSIKEMEQVCEKYLAAMSKLGEELLDKFFKLLNISDKDMAWLNSKPKVGLKLLHYSKPDKNNISSELNEHTDACFLTLLTVGTTGFSGLQVRDPETQEWINIDLQNKHAIILNTGSYLEILSNGFIKSTLHRVVPVSQERFSCPLFYSTNIGNEIKPLSLFKT